MSRSFSQRDDTVAHKDEHTTSDTRVDIRLRGSGPPIVVPEHPSKDAKGKLKGVTGKPLDVVIMKGTKQEKQNAEDCDDKKYYDDRRLRLEEELANIKKEVKEDRKSGKL